MRKELKFSLLILFLLVFIPTVYSANCPSTITSTYVTYYDFEQSNPTDTFNGNSNLTNVGFTCGTPGKIGNGCYNNTINNGHKMNTTTTDFPVGNKNRTVNVWIKDYSTNEGTQFMNFWGWGYPSGNGESFTLFWNIGTHTYYLGLFGNTGDFSTNVIPRNTTNYHMDTFVYNHNGAAGNLSYYRNGIFQTSYLLLGTTVLNTNGGTPFAIGSINTGGWVTDSGADFYIDEMSISNSSWNQSQVTDAWNNGDGCTYSTGGASATAPVFALINLTPASLYSNQNLTCNYKVTDAENTTMSVNVSFYGTNFLGSYLDIGYQNNTLNSTQINVGVQTTGTVLYCNVTAKDGTNITINQSNTATIIDTCTYTGGDWVISGNDNCRFTTTQTVSGNVIINGNVTFNSTGKWLFNSTNQKVFITKGSQVSIEKGGGWNG